MNLVLIDRIENEVAKTRSDDDADVRFVCFSARERMITELTRSFDKTRDKT